MMRQLILFALMILSTNAFASDVGVGGPRGFGGSIPRFIDDLDLRGFDRDSFLVCTQDGCIDYSDPDNDNPPKEDPPKDENPPKDDNPQEDPSKDQSSNLNIGHYDIVRSGARFDVQENVDAYILHETAAEYVQSYKALGCSTYVGESFIIDKDCLNN